jgi:hypothetical protein
MTILEAHFLNAQGLCAVAVSGRRRKKVTTTAEVSLEK